MKDIKSVGLIGLGALGILYAQRLFESGAELDVIVDEARKASYEESGVFCNGKKIDFPYVTPAQAKPVDLLIVATKQGGLEGAMETAAGFVGEDTLIISVLNGIISEEILAKRFGAEKVLYCTAQGTDAVCVNHRLTYVHSGTITLGEKEPGPITPRVEQTAQFLTAHGVKTVPVEDMVRRQWGKLMLNVGINQAVMVFEGDYATVQRPGKPREVMLGAMREVQKLSVLEGYPITDAEYDDWVALADSLAPAGKPSMRQDGEAHRKSEVELFAGTIIRKAMKYGLDVPVNRWLYERVMEMEAAY